MLRIYHPTLDDLPAILHVQQTCYRADYLESEMAFRAKLALSAQTCWLVENAGEPVGYLITLLVNYETFPLLNAPAFEACSAPELLYVHDLAITPAGRSLGLGKQLLAQALQAAKARGITKAGLIAVQASTAYWQHHGFECVDPAALALTKPTLVKKVASFGGDARYMEKSLR